MRGAAIAYFAFLGAIALLRIWELRRSADNWRHWSRGGGKPHPAADSVVQRMEEPTYPWMVALHTSFFALLPLEWLARGGTIGGTLSWIAIVATALALALRWWTLNTMGRSWNVRIVYATEEDGNREDAGPRIVDGGPYRWIRHPNYVVVCLELAAIPLIAHLYFSSAFLTVANALVFLRRIRDEERCLMQNAEWRAKMSAKPRFIPRLW